MFLFLSSGLMAQRVTGLVLDRTTQLPLALANVRAGFNTYYTDHKGHFSFARRLAKDTVVITSVGYKPYHLIVASRMSTDTVKIFMEQVSVMLKSVEVGARYNFKKDSLKNRRLFSSVYGYKSAGIKDAFAQKVSLAYKPDNHIDAPNSTASLAGVNLLSVISLFKKGNNNISKLQKVMLEDEESSYVDRAFSKRKVSDITSLKGDSLHSFILKYRPSIIDIKKMTDYDLMRYIKRSYKEFKQ
jgi:hypothetical protein